MCTGLPTFRGRAFPAPRVYPRVYGATDWSEEKANKEEGLSPCVRGYRRVRAAGGRHHGSIPVCTGLPSVDTLARRSGRVYPRVYGATLKPRVLVRSHGGLSPCVRGYRARRIESRKHPGSIPVCTGLPNKPLIPHQNSGVYPRVYGATAFGSGSRGSFLGLSPCVRGYQSTELGNADSTGSIPVCTGLPRSASLKRARRRVYPRVYGATLKPRVLVRSHGGLSPCVRGYLRLVKSNPVCPGSIPVCTGLPMWEISTGGSIRVYPRVYGATCTISSSSVLALGLSPCVRGYRPRGAR